MKPLPRRRMTMQQAYAKGKLTYEEVALLRLLYSDDEIAADRNMPFDDFCAKYRYKPGREAPPKALPFYPDDEIAADLMSMPVADFHKKYTGRDLKAPRSLETLAEEVFGAASTLAMLERADRKGALTWDDSDPGDRVLRAKLKLFRHLLKGVKS